MQRCIALARASRHARLLAPFRDARSRRLIAAFLTSELGDGITAVVVPLGVYAVSDSVVALAATFLGRLLVGSLFAALGGHVADRVDRRRLLLASYVVRGSLVATLIPLADASPAVFATLGVLIGASGSFDNPAAEASLRVAFRHDLQALATARKSGRTVSGMVGPAMGGVLFSYGGLGLALAVNVATFIVAVVLLSPQRAMPSSYLSAGPLEPELGRLDKVASTRLRKPVPGIALLAFVSTAGASFLVGLATVVAVPYLDGLELAPEGAYGYALSSYSCGALLGLWLAGLGDWHSLSLKALLVLSSVTYGLLNVGSVASPRWEFFALAWLLWGVCFGPEDVVGDARVAELIPDAWLARIYALWSIVGKLGAAAAYILVISLSGVSEKNILMVAGVAYAIVMPLLLARIREK